MKSWLPALFVLLLMSLSGFAASPRDAQWAEVRAALDQGLPQTALERLKPILASAVAAQSWGEVARVIAQRVTLEAQIQGGLPEERVLRYQAALPEAPEPVRPLVQALLAHSYWAYFEQNKWRVRNRTASEEPPSDDFRTWDVRRLFAAIDASFSAALAQPEALRSLPIAQFDGFLQPGTVPDRFRPTLYDFLAHEALAFYVSGEQAGARPEDAWTVPVDSPAFAPRSAFLAWTPAAPESPSVEFQSIRLYQDLLRSHLGDTDRSALLDADLARLRFAGNVATGGDREVRVLQALSVFAETEANHEISALARHAAAELHRHRGELAEAHRLASAGARAFPDSPGGKLCQNLVRLLETPRLRVQTEQVWCAPWPELTLHHANQRQAFFRVVRTDWDQFLDRRRRRPEQMTPQDRVALLRETPVHAWSVDLPATPDFKEHRTRSAVPSQLTAGYYFLLASRRADFGEEENEVSYTPFWVSDLALVVQTRRGLFEGWVLDAQQGTPVEGARVEAWYLGDNGTRMPLPAVRSDADGAFTFSGRAAAPRTPGHLFKATLGNRVIATSSDVAAFEFDSPQGPQEQTLFFTDRALYRPGQSIHYKGICILSRPGDQTYFTLSNRTVTVLLRDANGQELSRASHRANDYGSFSGSFTTPPGTLTGSFTLAIENGPPGAHSVQVEEYKRPRFETLLDAPREGGRLGAEVIVPGRATTYAGTPVDAAQVRWTVRRQMRFPPWWGWRVSTRPRHHAPQEIAHGDATTKADGSFEVSFTALPDPQAQAQPDTSFSFEIQAEVTDASGETRVASRTVRFGPAALEIQCPAPEWPVAGQPVTLRITTRTLDDVGVRARGTIKIHRLRQPERVQRAPLEEQVPMSPEGDEDARDQNDPDRWELAELVSELPFTSGTNGVAEPTVNLPGGAYRALLAADDGHGKTVTHQVPLLVRDPNASAAAIRLPM
ncbi:MAG: hypothetical protein IT580_05240, partial [Verrucomicrobiales bacterium]|nr:hypothetical protein [Verrucomicrobiales bacterium]